MKFVKLRVASLAAVQALILSACGGGGDDSPVDSAPAARPSAAGIWTGSLTPVGGGPSATAVAIVLEDGTTLTRLSPLVIPPSVISLPYMLTGMLCCNESVDSHLQGAAPTPYGNLMIPSIRVQGTVGQDQFTGSITPISASGVTHTFSFTRQKALYERGLTMNTLSGTYTGTQSVTSGGSTTNYVFTMNISSTGALTGGVTPGTCMVNGQLSIPNASENVFRIQTFNVFNCSSGGASFNTPFNKSYPGLGFLADDNTTPPGTSNLLAFYANNGLEYWPIFVLRK